MVDFMRIPTTRESEFLRKCGRSDALKYLKTDEGEFLSLYADEVAKTYEAACEGTRAEYEGRVAKCKTAYDAAIDDMQRARKALDGIKQRALPSGNSALVDYQGEYRSKLKNEALEGKTAQAAGEVRAAKSDADEARIQAMSAIAFFRERAILWLRPYCQGVSSVSPSLVEKLRPFDMLSMFSNDDQFGFISEMDKKHPNLHGGSDATKPLE